MDSRIALVIDDSRSARFVMRKFLESHGYTVDTAESAQDAYFYLRRKRPDVVFLDHLMPGTDGFDALKVLRQDAGLKGLPIVLCSSNEDPAFIADACAKGVVDVLPKPPSPADLGALLKRIEQAALTGWMPPRRLAAPLVHAPASNDADDGTPGDPVEDSPQSLGEELAARFEGLSHMLYLQIAELRAQIAHLASARSGDCEDGLRGLSPELMQARFEALTHHLEDTLTAHGRAINATLEAQSRRIDNLHTLILRVLDQDAAFRISPIT